MATYPRYRVGPSHRAIAAALDDVTAGRCDRLMIFMPPRHGKSELASIRFPAFYLGQHPDRRIIAASYTAQLAEKFSWSARNLAQSPAYQAIFPEVSLHTDRQGARNWELRTGGGYVAAGVGGPITGHGAHLLLIDDPIKNSQQADSLVYRDTCWDWYTSTAYTRLEEGGAVILIMTRWHPDDLAGRLLAQMEDGEGDQWRIVKLPALAEPTEAEPDQLGRAPGQALWPEKYDAPRLDRIRTTLGPRYFEALYQQSPRDRQGSLFQRGWFEIVREAPAGLTSRVRYWDLAASQAASADWSVGLLMAIQDGRFWILDVRRIQGSPADIEALVRQTALLDGKAVRVGLEQEPGSASIHLIDHYRRRVLAGHAVIANKVTGSKAQRAQPLSAAAQAGNVKLLHGRWNNEFLNEIEAFPRGAHDDQVDGASGAHHLLTQGDLPFGWMTA